MQSNNESRTDDMLRELASDFSNYLVVDTSGELTNLQGTVKKLSSNLEEFSSLLDSITLDTSLCVDNLLPQIVDQFDKLQSTFDQIDKLETVVDRVEQSVSAMETEVAKAETYLGSESVLKSVFKPFLQKVSNPPANATPPAYKPVDIFKTEDLFKDNQP